MGKHYGYGQGSRRKIIKKWEEHNIFGEDGVDMLGILMDEDNVQSVHHIFDRYGNCVGVSCLSRYIHDYLDFYLKLEEKEEYDDWNEYLRDVYEYVTNNVRMISLYELKTMRNELLDSVRTNRLNNYRGRTKRKYASIRCKVMPYLEKEIDDIESLYRTLPNTYKFIPTTDLPLDTNAAIKRYFDEKCEKTFKLFLSDDPKIKVK